MPTFPGNVTAMTNNEETAPTEKNHPNELGDLVRVARKRLGLTQDELATQLDKSRWWVIQLEKGESYYSAKTNSRGVKIEPMMCVRLADILNLDPADVLFAAGVPKSDWPNFSNIISKSDSVRAIDVTSLTLDQARLIKGLVEELKKGNTAHERDRP